MLVYSAAITRYQSPLRHQRVQHITLRQSINGRTVEWQFYFTKYKLYIVTILECIVLFSFSFSLNFVVEDVACSWSNFSLAEMVVILPNITAITHNIAWVDRKTVNWTWFPFKMQGYSLLSFQNSEFLFFSFFCLNFAVESLTCSAFSHEMVLILSTLRLWRRITNRKIALIKVNSQI